MLTVSDLSLHLVRHAS